MKPLLTAYEFSRSATRQEKTQRHSASHHRGSGTGVTSPTSAERTVCAGQSSTDATRSSAEMEAAAHTDTRPPAISSGMTARTAPAAGALRGQPPPSQPTPPSLPLLAVAERPHNASPLTDAAAASPANAPDTAAGVADAAVAAPLPLCKGRGTHTPPLHTRRPSHTTAAANHPAEVPSAPPPTRAPAAGELSQRAVSERLRRQPPSSASSQAFEQRRIPLPPPTAVDGASAAVCALVPKPPPASLTVHAAPASTTAARRAADSVEPLPHTHTLHSSPTDRRARPSLSPLPPHCAAGSAPLQLASSTAKAPRVPTPPRTSVFVPSPILTTAEVKAAGGDDNNINEHAMAAAATALLNAQPRPVSPVFLARAAGADGADNEQARIVRDLLSWKRGGGRHRHLLLRGSVPEDSRCDVQPVTVHTRRPHHPFGPGNDLSAEEAPNAGAASLTGASCALVLTDADAFLSAADILPAASQLSPEAAAVLPPRQVRPSASRHSHEAPEDAGRRLEGSQPQMLRMASSRSYLSILSRSSTPDAARGTTDGSAHFRRHEASPRQLAGLRHSLSSDRAFTRPSSTSLIAEVHHEGSGRSRSEAGGWGGSSRHMNLSTLTISCAPQLGSFSTNSESSMFA